MRVRLTHITNPFSVTAPSTRVIRCSRGSKIIDCIPEDNSQSVVIHNGHRTEDLFRQLSDDDLLVIVRLPHGIGIVLFVLAVVLAVVNYIAVRNLLPDDPVERDDESSDVKGFGAIGNSRAEGLPIAIGYGEHRVGGQIIQEFTTTFGSPPKTIYRALISLGWGPIESIGQYRTDTPNDQPLQSDSLTDPLPDGMEIQQNDAKNYDGVKVWLRMGTLEQEVIPGFEKVVTQFPVQQTLLQQEQVGPINTAIAVQGTVIPDTADDPIWTQYAVGYTMTEDADRAVIVLRFPQGLYTQDASTGAVIASQVSIMIRYRELDGGGSPITTGGPNNDGWVRLPYDQSIHEVKQALRGQFTHEIPIFLYDPQTFVAPTLGQCVVSDNLSYCEATGISGVPTVGTPLGSFTMTGWFYIQTLADDAVIMELHDGTNGISFKMSAAALGKWVPGIQVNGSGSFVLNIFASPDMSDYLNTWQMWTLTHDADANFTTLYFNDVPFWYFFGGGALPTVNSADELRIGFGGSTIRSDSVRFIPRHLDSIEIGNIYNFRNGLDPTIPGVADGDIAAYAFDGAATDSSQNGNTITLVSNGGVIVYTSGTVVTVPPGTPNRSRYLIEVLRINEDSTNSRTQDEASFDQIKFETDVAINYGGLALAGVEILATDQLSSGQPRTTFISKLRKLDVWDGIDAQNPTFVNKWSPFPPWQIADAVTSKRFGAGAEFEITDIDWPSFMLVASRCADIVYDKRGGQSTGPTDWDEARYDSTITDPDGLPRGGIEITFTTADFPRWAIPGRFVRLSGWPDPTDGYPSIVNDINSSALTGYEIKETKLVPGGSGLVAQVIIYWDRLTELGPWTDGAFLTTVMNPDSVFGDIEGGEHRFETHAFLDKGEKFWDEIVRLAAACRARPVLQGRRLSLIDDRPRTVGDIINGSNTLDGTFRLTFEGPATKPNHVDVQFLDRDLNYKRTEQPLSDEQSPEVSLNNLRRQSFFMPYVTSRRQIAAQAAFVLNRIRLLMFTGGFTMGFEALPLQAGSVVSIASDLIAWGFGGRIFGQQATNSVIIDKDVTILTGVVYKIQIKNADDGEVEVQTVTDPGVDTTFNAGDIIALDGSFSWNPKPDDVYTLHEDGDEKEAKIIGVGLSGDDMEFAVQFEEYNGDIHTDDWFEDITGADVNIAPGPLPSTTLPGNVDEVTVTDFVEIVPGGGYKLKLQATWQHDRDTENYIAKTVVWYGLLGAPIGKAEVPGAQASFDLDVSHLNPGDVIEVAFQPETYEGVRRSLRRCTRQIHTVQALEVTPEAVTDLVIERHGDLATYRWTSSLSVTAQFLLRLGGWILGMDVESAVIGRRRIGPTSFWASGDVEADGKQGPPCFVRRIGATGAVGDAATLDYAYDHGTVPEGASQLWHEYVDGWLDDLLPSPNPVLTNLQRRSDGALEFTGSNLTATYEVPYTLFAFSARKPRRVTVEAFYEAEQVPEETWADLAGWSWQDWQDRSYSWEGYADLKDSTPRCTVTLEVAFFVPGGAGLGDYQEYKPGIVMCSGASWRITLTRPSSSYQVRLSRFSTRLASIPPQANERNDSTNWGVVDFF